MENPDLRAISVSELSARIRKVLGDSFARVWVVGEISGIRRPSSGHVYFTLKDDGAQISSVMWRREASRLAFSLDEGLEIVAEGTLDLYPPRGQYQLVIQRLQPKGLGPLQLAFRQMYERLKKEGLFDAARKRRIPAFPRRVGIVTSRTAAALQDILNVMFRRWPLVTVLLFPARVQGEGAAEEIARRIHHANSLSVPLDVLIVGRGGGSLEDLWAFNEEVVARAIHASRVPVVSAVGHEIDVTIADFVADRRAQTPTEAAEICVPSAEEIEARLREARRALASALRRRVELARGALAGLARSRSLAAPLELVRERERRLDELSERLDLAARRRLATLAERVGAIERQLEGVSPLAVLGRGYSVTTRRGRVVRDPAELAPGDVVETRVQGGEFRSRVAGEAAPVAPVRSIAKQSSLFEGGE